MNILAGNGNLTLSGSLIVIAEYTALIYGLSLLERQIKPALKPKTKKK